MRIIGGLVNAKWECNGTDWNQDLLVRGLIVDGRVDG